MTLGLISCICSPILLDDVIDDMICLIKTDSILTLDNIST